MRERFLKNGLEGFSEHEILEFLLFYSVPRQNTNATAHKLLEHFKTLDRVLDADFDELCKIDGISNNSATLIKLLPHLFRAYTISKTNNDVTYDGVDKIGEYLLKLYEGITRECVYLLLFNPKMKLIGTELIHVGTINSSDINPEKAAEIVFSRRASCFVIAHNHPGGVCEPSPLDLTLTRQLYRAFELFSRPLLEHIIVADGDYIPILRQSLAMGGEFRQR